VGVYRLLAGDNYGLVAYDGVPVAVAPNDYNRPEDTDQTRVAYGFDNNSGQQVGWADWCGACHGDFHSNGNYVHPVDSSMSGVVTNYNQYVKTADLGGNSTNSYLSLTPFARGGAAGSDYAALALQAKSDDSDLSGPIGADLVTCFSCHRAHASGFPYALRWNGETEILTYDGAWPGTDNGAPAQFARGRTEAEMQTAYYERPASTFATYQRSLCNKCHVKD
jgi:cytochrome c553